MADVDAVEAAKLALLSLVDASLEGEEVVSSESKIAELEATIATQVEFYFSADNLPGDQFLQGQLKQGGDNKVSLKAVAKFSKMKKLLARLAKLSGTEGADPSVGLLKLLSAASSPHLLLSDDGGFNSHIFGHITSFLSALFRVQL